MGVLSGKDVFSPKYITAEITDSSSRLYFVPIKYVIGDYFLADIDNKLFCFRIVGSREKTYRHTAIRSFRVLHYDTSHYMPLSPNDTKALSDILVKNNLPKLNMRLHRILKALGERETKELTTQEMKEFLDEMSKHYDETDEEFKNIKAFIEMLGIKQIIGPVRQVTEFIQEDLIATDPKFLGDIVSTYQRLDGEDKKITNTPITGKLPWVKICLIVAMIGAIGGFAYWAYSSGTFSNISIPGFGQPAPPSVPTLLEQYPTPESLKAAIDRGEVDYDSLPPEIKVTVDAIKPPNP